jgi:hypothetical protein
MVRNAPSPAFIVLCFVATAVASGTCKAYSKTGVSYNDANITVIKNIKSTADCCTAGFDYNTKAAQAKKPLGKIAVWWKDYNLCLVKASGDKPVPMLHTSSSVIETSSGMPLYLLSKEMSTDRGAVCLDGSPPGFYADFVNNGTTSTKWVLYFKGGGWCYDEKSCASRAKSNLGSSTKFAPTFSFSGPMDNDPAVNPEFYNYNRVVLYYCDGGSFSGNKDEPFHYAPTNQTLYFRGARVLDAMLDTLIADHNLGKATDVLLSGGSAGGLSTYLHTDHVHSYLLSKQVPLKRFKAAPVSGFFLMHATEAGEMAYPDNMKYLFNMQNSTGGVNSDCIASYAKEPTNAWRCIFANESYAHTKAPMFPLQSAVDAWQMGNVFKPAGGCTKNDFAKCTPGEVASVNGYLSDFMTDLRASSKFGRAGEGGFVESCLEHCGAQNAKGFDGYTIKSTAMDAALTGWWNSDGSDPASAHWYLPCNLNTAAPHQCNPSCDGKGAREAGEAWTKAPMAQ